MSKITIGMTFDGTTVDTAAVCPGPQLSEQAFEEAPEEAPANDETAQGGARMIRPVPHVKTVRRSLGLTQEEFAARYGIPVGTLRDWEQGRTEPDQPARAYIRVIASNPEWVSRALAAESQ
jgi:putative transcriptional regulator